VDRLRQALRPERVHRNARLDRRVAAGYGKGAVSLDGNNAASAFRFRCERRLGCLLGRADERERHRRTFRRKPLHDCRPDAPRVPENKSDLIDEPSLRPSDR
jgi:hypothetical protein